MLPLPARLIGSLDGRLVSLLASLPAGGKEKNSLSLSLLAASLNLSLALRNKLRARTSKQTVSIGFFFSRPLARQILRRATNDLSPSLDRAASSPLCLSVCLSVFPSRKTATPVTAAGVRPMTSASRLGLTECRCNQNRIACSLLPLLLLLPFAV